MTKDFSTKGFSAEEFEPDPNVIPEDDDDGGGPPPGAGHNSHGKPSEHAKVGQTLLGMMHHQGTALRDIPDPEMRTHLWYYKAGLWTMLPEPVKWLNHAIEVTLRAIGKAHKSKDKFVTEIRKYIERSPDIKEPCVILWNDHGKIPTRSGLLDPITLTVEPYKKEHYATWRLDLDYDPDAKCPLWLELLGDYFSDKPAEEREPLITLLQDFAGTTLIDKLPKSLKRALVLYGASDTGKSIFLRVIAAILSDKTISKALAEITGTHALEEFMFRRPWVLDEAFDANVWILSAIVKAIISREPLSINRKNLALITIAIVAPCIWSTNHPPNFKESTEAMVNRLLIVHLTRVFRKDDPLVGVAAKAKAVNPLWEPFDLILDRERAGVFAWMVAGLQRVLERGNFVNTEEGNALLTEMRLNANPVAGFIRDCIKYDVDAMISTADFHAAFTGWRLADHGDEKVNFSRISLGKYLSALADPKILQDRDVFKKKDGSRYYVGIRLNEQGGEHFETVAIRQALTPDLKFQKMSPTKEGTHQPIPPC